jgi:hypothetical protein
MMNSSFTAVPIKPAATYTKVVLTTSTFTWRDITDVGSYVTPDAIFP